MFLCDLLDLIPLHTWYRTHTLASDNFVVEAAEPEINSKIQAVQTSAEDCNLPIWQFSVAFYFEKGANLTDTTFRTDMADAKPLGATKWAFVVDQAILHPAPEMTQTVSIFWIAGAAVGVTCNHCNASSAGKLQPLTHHRLPARC